MDSEKAGKFRKLVSSRFRLQLFFLKSLPLAWLVGLRISRFNDNECAVSVPFRYLTKNPFRSVYFACLAMAAELSTGLLCMQWVYKSEPPVSMLITAMNVNYIKKANGRIVFTCLDGEAIREAYNNALRNDIGSMVKICSTGTNETGETVASFDFTWSFKKKGEKA